MPTAAAPKRQFGMTNAGVMAAHTRAKSGFMLAIMDKLVRPG